MNPALTSVCLSVIVNLVRGDDVRVLTSASSGFSQRLYQKIAKGKLESTVYSPYSIHSSLTMVSAGARGETATELSGCLGLSTLIGNSANQAYHDLIVQLNNATDVKLHTANAIFVNPNHAIEPQFVKDVKADYFATSSNFQLGAFTSPEKAINDFVNATTEGLIQDVLPAGTIHESTSMLLVNAIFFSGTWAQMFPASRTHKEYFRTLCGSTTQVDMMSDERYVNIKSSVDGVDVAELPFLGGRFSLYIALPRTDDGIAHLENSLDSPVYFCQLFAGLSPVRVRLNIPRFKIEYKLKLNSALRELGISNAFQPLSYSFQGIDALGSIYISDVIHKAVIEVKETGTVAASGTGTLPTLPPTYDTPFFTADHPFIFFIRDTRTGAILLQGKFTG